MRKFIIIKNRESLFQIQNQIPFNLHQNLIEFNTFDSIPIQKISISGKIEILEISNVSGNLYQKFTRYIFKKIKEGEAIIICFSELQNFLLENNLNIQEFTTWLISTLNQFRYLLYLEQGLDANLHNLDKLLITPLLGNLNELTELLMNRVYDLSSYENIFHIGDIQGCFDPILKFFELHPISDKNFYIFTGDYIDRGTQNYEVLNYLGNLLGKKNIVFIEGNHDRHLWNWSYGNPVTGDTFISETAPELETHNYPKEKGVKFSLNLIPYFCYKYNDFEVFCSHGGHSSKNLPFELYPVTNMISGCGQYIDGEKVDDLFLLNMGKNVFQIHGHRNPSSLPIQVNQQCFNLEGKVEFKGCLRVINLHNNEFIPIQIQN